MSSDSADKPWKTFLALLFVCALLRMPFWCFYAPMTGPDSASYESMASYIASSDFTDYLAKRTPVYPLLILLCRFDHGLLWVIQSIMGIAVSLMLFSMAYTRTGRLFPSFLAGLSYSFFITLTLFEMFVLTETMSIFLVVLSLFLFMRTSRPGREGVVYCLALGLVVSLAGLTRPLLLILVPLYIAFIVYRWQAAGKAAAGKVRGLLCFAVPAVGIVLGWCVFNMVAAGYFGPTSFTGYNLTQHSGAFMELAGDEYSEIRDVYLKHREIQRNEIGTHSMAIWRAVPEMQEATGLSYGELSRKLARLSIGLFVRHPIHYSQGVAKAWLRFWTFNDSCPPLDETDSKGVRNILAIVWWMENRLFLLPEAVFMIVVLSFLYSIIFRKKVDSEWDLLIVLIVAAASVLQAMMEFGENARYSIPFRPLVLYIGVLYFQSLLCTARRLLFAKKGLDGS